MSNHSTRVLQVNALPSNKLKLPSDSVNPSADSLCDSKAAPKIFESTGRNSLAANHFNRWLAEVSARQFVQHHMSAAERRNCDQSKIRKKDLQLTAKACGENNLRRNKSPDSTSVRGNGVAVRRLKKTERALSWRDEVEEAWKVFAELLLVCAHSSL